MKTVPFLVLAFAASALADRLVTLAWEPSVQQSADGYRVWNSTGPVPALLAAVPSSPAEVEIPETEQRITVTAWSLTGESGHSLPLTIPATEPPRTVWPVTLTLQYSIDNVTWQTRSVTYYQETSPVGFYRLKIETQP